MGRDILIVADGPHAPSPIACELLTLGRRLAAAARVGVLVIGGDEPAVDAWAARGADTIYRVRGEPGADPVPELQLAAAAEATRRAKAGLVILPHSLAGTEIAPRLAFRLDGGVATGCIDIVAAEDGIRCTRPCYGGLAREEDEFSSGPVVATVRAGIFERALAQAVRPIEVIDLGEIDADAARVRRVERRTETTTGVRLEDARVIVAGGRGLEGPDGFHVLAELAHELHGAVGSSRVPCDLGWCPHSWQIGLTGKTVTPELYIAVGISGAGHHMAGCGNAKAIVAINSDADAAIFQDARFGIVGDYREVLPAMIQQVRRLNEASGGKP